MPKTPPNPHAAQTHSEALAFIEEFARINVEFIRETFGSPVAEAVEADSTLAPDWDDPRLLAESGLTARQVDEETRSGKRYLHIDVAAAQEGLRARALFLAFTGLSSKLQKLLFPALCSRLPYNRAHLSQEVSRLNAWLDWVRRDDFDPAAFVTYQRGLGVHGRTQNLTGAIGATGAAIAFMDAIRTLDAAAISDHAGDLPPQDVRSPSEVYRWRAANQNATVKALLLRNGRALVFASSKDANIFMPLGKRFADAEEALWRFNQVRNDQAERSQVLHEFAVGKLRRQLTWPTSTSGWG